jgi:hypothetical protein
LAKSKTYGVLPPRNIVPCAHSELIHSVILMIGGWIILGWILERWDEVMWTGLVWLRIGTGGELL